MSVHHGINNELLFVNEDNYFWSSFMLQIWVKLWASFYADSLGFGCQKVSPPPYVRLHVKIQFDCQRHSGERHWPILGERLHWCWWINRNWPFQASQKPGSAFCIAPQCVMLSLSFPSILESLENVIHGWGRKFHESDDICSWVPGAGK